jgi:hypothetical protein
LPKADLAALSDIRATHPTFVGAAPI